MFYRIEAYDRDGSQDLRARLRPEHLAYWQSKGASVAAGGALLSSDSDDAAVIGSMLIVEALDRQAVAMMIANDPFTLHGVFSSRVEVTRWRPAIGRWCV